MESRRRGGEFSSSTWYSAHTNRPSEIVLDEKPIARLRLRFPQRVRSIPRLWWRLIPLYRSFSGATAGQFQPEQPGTAAQAEVSTIYSIDGPRSIRSTCKAQFPAA
jgi:hypothetical protein